MPNRCERSFILFGWKAHNQKRQVVPSPNFFLQNQVIRQQCSSIIPTLGFIWTLDWGIKIFCSTRKFFILSMNGKHDVPKTKKNSSSWWWTCRNTHVLMEHKRLWNERLYRHVNKPNLLWNLLSLSLNVVINYLMSQMRFLQCSGFTTCLSSWDVARLITVSQLLGQRNDAQQNTQTVVETGPYNAEKSSRMWKKKGQIRIQQTKAKTAPRVPKSFRQMPRLFS